VAVSFRGLLHEAESLAKAAAVTSPHELLKLCEGWWLAEVEGYWTEDGTYVHHPPYEPPSESDDGTDTSDDGKPVEKEPSRRGHRMGGGQAAEAKGGAGKKTRSAGVTLRSRAKGAPSSLSRSSSSSKRSRKQTAPSPSPSPNKPTRKRSRRRSQSSPSSSSPSSSPPSSPRPSEDEGTHHGRRKEAGRKSHKATRGGKGVMVNHRRGKGCQQAKDLPRIKYVKLLWYVAHSEDGLLGRTNLPLVLLQHPHVRGREPDYVTDKVSRLHLCAEEDRPGKWSFTQKGGRLHASTIRVISTCAPDVMLNHAGEALDIVSGFTPSPEERSFWDATIDEIKGFTWKEEVDVSEDDATQYEVVGIYRPPGVARTYVVVQAQDMEQQFDHRLAEIRERMFYLKVGIHYKRLPLFLQWPQLRSSQFSKDYDMFKDNAKLYMNARR